MRNGMTCVCWTLEQPPNCPSESFIPPDFHFLRVLSSPLQWELHFPFYVLALLEVVSCDFCSGLPNTVFGISSCAPLPSIYYLWSPDPLPGNKDKCLFVFLMQSPRGSLPASQMKPCVRPVASIHFSPGFCLISLLFLNDAFEGKRQAFWKNISPAYQFFFFFFQIVPLVSYLRILCLTHGHKDFLLCFPLKVLHVLFRSV